jgi:hypothetical protein
LIGIDQPKPVARLDRTFPMEPIPQFFHG